MTPTPLKIPLLLALCVAGCATLQEKQVAQDWATICAATPYAAGQSITLAEQRAMTRLDIWKLSVEEVNERCARR